MFIGDGEDAVGVGCEDARESGDAVLGVSSALHGGAHPNLIGVGLTEPTLGPGLGCLTSSTGEEKPVCLRSRSGGLGGEWKLASRP